jgi:hypothetical protein
MFGGSVHIIRKNTETLEIASKKISLEANDEKNKNMIMSREQNAVQNSDIYIGNESFKTVKKYKYVFRNNPDKSKYHS